jgi:predicted metal-binding transcription factor (methanogenesis marker protein 9)
LLLWVRNGTVHVLVGRDGMVLEFSMLPIHLCPAHDALLNEEVEYFIG